MAVVDCGLQDSISKAVLYIYSKSKSKTIRDREASNLFLSGFFSNGNACVFSYSSTRLPSESAGLALVMNVDCKLLHQVVGTWIAGAGAGAGAGHVFCRHVQIRLT